MPAVVVAVAAVLIVGRYVINLGSVPLLTKDVLGGVGCYTFGVHGTLVEDAKTGGLVMVVDGGEVGGPGSSHPIPVIFPEGYTANRIVGGVAVKNRSGKIVATTGHGYFECGYAEGGFFACGGG